MFDWLFWFAPQQVEKIQVQLIPEGGATGLPGFHGGGLTLIANRGDTLQKVMDNFNTYRGPDSAIRKLYTRDGSPIPFSTVLSGPITCVVRV
jgi:hypothetical protein